MAVTITFGPKHGPAGPWYYVFPEHKMDEPQYVHEKVINQNTPVLKILISEPDVAGTYAAAQEVVDAYWKDSEPSFGIWCIDTLPFLEFTKPAHALSMGTQYGDYSIALRIGDMTLEVNEKLVSHLKKQSLKGNF